MMNVKAKDTAHAQYYKQESLALQHYGKAREQVEQLRISATDRQKLREQQLEDRQEILQENMYFLKLTGELYQDATRRIKD